MKKRESNMKRISLILLLVLLTSCVSKISTSCPPIIEYTQEFKQQLADDLEKEESYYIKQVVVDYYNLREKIRVCND